MTATATPFVNARTLVVSMLRSGENLTAIAACLEEHEHNFFKKVGLVKVVAAWVFSVLNDMSKTRAVLECWYEGWVIDRALRV